MNNERAAARAALAAILIVGLAFRLHNIGFGLPSLYDPDEPIFMLIALKLPLEHTLNPGWFGHPGSTTIYLLALIDCIVVGLGLLSGRFQSIPEFAHAAYAHPGLLFIPSRIAMAVIGVICIWLTYLVGRRLHGTSTGLIAAGLLAINSLHIAWSQVVRTDIQASAFMLGSLIFSIKAAADGRRRDFLLAGMLAGFAVATKWPAATVFIAVAGASACRMAARADGARRGAANLALAGAALIGGLFIASPFIFLDWQTVLDNVPGEVTAGHLGHNGGGLLANAGWYLGSQVAGTMGIIGLALVVAGIVMSGVRSRISRFTLIPAAVALFLLICSQPVIWSRWLLPVMPMFCIFAAIALVSSVDRIAPRTWAGRRHAMLTALAFVIAIPSLSGALAESRERANDTRAMAARWAIANIPPGSTVLLEHLELSLRGEPWKILFPMGNAGCIDALHALRTDFRYDQVQAARTGAIVDLGNISPARESSCRADYAILSYYDLYRAEADRYPAELDTYRRVLSGGKTVELFTPVPGRSGGPVVRIVAMPQH